MQSDTKELLEFPPAAPPNEDAMNLDARLSRISSAKATHIIVPKVGVAGVQETHTADSSEVQDPIWTGLRNQFRHKCTGPDADIFINNAHVHVSCLIKQLCVYVLGRNYFPRDVPFMMLEIAFCRPGSRECLPFLPGYALLQTPAGWTKVLN